MKTLQVALAVAGLALLGAQPLIAATSALDVSTMRLEPRIPPAKPLFTKIGPDQAAQKIVVKIREGEFADLQDGLLLGADHAGLGAVNGIVYGAGAKMSRLFTSPPADLRSHRDSGQRLSGKQLADLTLYFTVDVPSGTSARRVEAMVDALNSLAVVEIAYVQAESTNAAADIPPATPNFEFGQRYLERTRNGIHARYAWEVPGAKGTGVRIADIEFGWTTTHEDLKAPIFAIGTQQQSSIDHGTAVLGELIGDHNGFGISGIVPVAQYGLSSAWTQSIPSAITNASLNVQFGDVILIEQQYTGGPSTGSCGCGSCGFIPVEYFQADHDAIQTAVANGRVVVEAAGNGGMDLDHPVFGGAFTRQRDPGAIMVAASLSSDRVPICFTNYGTRIDLHGWGENVRTTGYGDLFFADANQTYTNGFNGTSSASPMIAGAAASVQGAQRAVGSPVYTPLALRQLLASTGTPQVPDARIIGPLPNLKAAFEASNPGGVGRLMNVSTRGFVGTGDSQLIGGFTISGPTAKTVAIQAIGPSLAPYFAPGTTVANPQLTVIRASDGALIAYNDNWQSDPNAGALQAAGFAPGHPLDAAVLRTLSPGAYTVVVSGVGGATGVGLVAAYEVDHPETPFINVSTRGFVGTGDAVLIGGITVTGSLPQTFAITAAGPSLAPYLAPGTVIANPMITLVRASDGAVIAFNDDWGAAANAAELQAAGFAPGHPNEAGILITLPPGAYTAIVQGVGGGTGVGLVAVYQP